MATFGYDMGGWGQLVASGERAAKVAAGGRVFYGVTVKIIKTQ